MHTFRFRVAGLMGAVLVIALGLAALRDASETWAGMTFLLTCGVLCLAIVGIVCGGIARARGGSALHCSGGAIWRWRSGPHATCR